MAGAGDKKASRSSPVATGKTREARSATLERRPTFNIYHDENDPSRREEIMEKKPKEKIDYRSTEWIDKFNTEFNQVQGIIELTTAAEFSDVPAERAKIGVVLNNTLEKMGGLYDLIQDVWESIRLSLHPKLSPEVEKKKKTLTRQRDEEYVRLGGKLFDKFGTKIKALERGRP